MPPSPPFRIRRVRSSTHPLNQECASKSAIVFGLLALFLLAGGSLPEFAYAQYAEQTGSDNPFDGVTATSTPAALDAVAGDFDTDGDVDLLAYDGSAERFYENDGTGTFTEQTGSDNPFESVSPAFATRGRTFVRDIDGDDDPDLVVFGYSSGGSGTLVLVENTDGSTYARQTGSDNPFEGLPVSGNQATVDAVMGDFSGNDAPDLLVYDGSSERYYENDGSGSFSEQTGSANPFDGLSQAFATKTTTLVRDFDDDGDMDLAFRDGTGDATAWRYREHTSSGFVARTGSGNPLSSVAADATAKSVAAVAGDLDLDGDLDLLTYNDGTQRYYGGDESGTFTERTGSDNPFDGAEPALRVTANTVVADIDRDRDGDLTFADADALRFVERTNAAVALTDGRDDANGGVDYSPPSSEPGTDANPVGRLSLNASGASASLRSLTVALDAASAQGVEAVELWASDDDAFASDTDTQVSPEATVAGSVSFDGLNLSLEPGMTYVFVVVDLSVDAGGALSPVLPDETGLMLGGGDLATVNGTESSTFTDAYLSVASAPLPVELAQFDGKTTTQEGTEKVKLAWKTASEQNNAGFRVERRVGVGERGDETGWTEVGFVSGAGTTSEVQTYRFTDTDLPYQADSLSYRLRQVDADGTTHLTDPVMVARSGPSGLELLGTAPNPVRTRVMVRYGVPESTESEVRLQLYDLLGRRLRSVQAIDKAGRHEQTLNVESLSSGIYILRLTAGGRAKTRKLTVVR